MYHILRTITCMVVTIQSVTKPTRTIETARCIGTGMITSGVVFTFVYIRTIVSVQGESISAIAATEIGGKCIYAFVLTISIVYVAFVFN